ncbi:hypothetical protein [Paenarthrobacter nitroguajacolicus]
MTTEQRMIGKAVDAPSRTHILGLDRSAKHRAQVESPAFRVGPLHIITGGRQEGKTRLSMQWLLNAPDGTECALVVANNDQAEHIKPEHGPRLKDPRIIGYRTLINHIRHDARERSAHKRSPLCPLNQKRSSRDGGRAPESKQDGHTHPQGIPPHGGVRITIAALKTDAHLEVVIRGLLRKHRR